MSVVIQGLRGAALTRDKEMNLEPRSLNGFTIIDIAGRINRLKDSIALRSFVKDILDKGAIRIGINLKDVSYLDSGALNVLIYCHNTLSKTGGQLVLIAPNHYVSDVLNVVGLDKIVKIFSSEEEFANDTVS